ncbi:MAG: NAD(P)/FAD-dependent oxidoreductase [Chitinophagaceae bacterium]
MKNRIFIKPKLDVLIVGAGASGLMAAREIAAAGKTCAVVEARDRAGGRIHTINDPKFHKLVELGAEFIHGNLPLTKGLLTHAGIRWFATAGDVWKNKNGEWSQAADLSDDFKGLDEAFARLKEDLPVATFLEQYVADPEQQEALKRYSEGYNAATTSTASSFALKATLTEEDSEQSRIEGGYGRLLNFLLDDLKSLGADIHFAAPVSRIVWQNGLVAASGNGQTWMAEKIIVTVPLGVLQNNNINFEPGLPAIENAIQSLGFGNAVKVVLQFDAAFWTDTNYTGSRNMRDLHFLFSNETIPTWWTQFPLQTGQLTGWLAGPGANRFLSSSNREILETALASLASLFNIGADSLLKKLVAWHVANWGSDPYSLGGYSFRTVGETPHKELIREGVANTLYFAGEVLFDGIEVGTVEAALWSGRDTAHRLLRDL